MDNRTPGPVGQEDEPSAIEGERTSAIEGKRNTAVFLIGMPAAGKSTLGVSLAQSLNRSFVDSDRLIEDEIGMSLQAYLDKNGYEALRAVEEKILLNTEFSNCIVATGGSVVYSDKGMKRLQSLGPCIYLYIDVTTMLQRLTNAQTRGLACVPGTPLEELYSERHPLYLRYADHRLNLKNDTVEQSLSKLRSIVAP